MDNNHPLDSLIYVLLPAGFSLPPHTAQAFVFDASIPLPVQCTSLQEKECFDIKTLTWEMILAGMLTHLAYPQDIQDKNHIAYYRNLLFAVRPNLKTELSEAAILKARNEDYDIAEEIFAALRGLDPLDMSIQLNTALFFDQRADSYRRSGLSEDADAYDDNAHIYYTRVLSAEPPVADAFFNAGFFYLKQQNFTRSRSCFETFISIGDGETENDIYKRERATEIVDDILSRNLDDELFKSAYDFISIGEEEKGLEKIRLFLETHPKVWNAWFLLGWGLRRLERWEDAKAAFLQTLLCGGENTDTCNELAICLMELDELKESKKYLTKALILEPENTKVMSNLGFLALRSENRDEARRYFLAALEFDPHDTIAKKALEDLQ